VKLSGPVSGGSVEVLVLVVLVLLVLALLVVELAHK
jgi:hypothetical protein